MTGASRESLRPRQLPLELGHSPALSRDDLIVSDANRAAVALVDRWPDWPSDNTVWIGVAAIEEWSNVRMTVAMQTGIGKITAGVTVRIVAIENSRKIATSSPISKNGNVSTAGMRAGTKSNWKGCSTMK